MNSPQTRNITPHSSLYRFTLFFCLNLPLVTECVRKYIWADLSVLILADGVAILVALWVIVKRTLGGTRNYWLIFGLYFVWGSITAIFTHASIALVGIGLRPLFIPLIYLTIAYGYFELPNSERLFLKSVTFWILVVGGVAFLQILLGRDHPINDLPAIVGDDYAGIGDYDVRYEGLEGFFRPTSIFFHTGKFGQTIFLLSLTITASAFSRVNIRPAYAGTVVFAWAALLLSGQRAGVVFIIFALGLILALGDKWGASKLSKIAIPMILLAGLSSIFSDDLRSLVFERAASGFTDSIDRVTENSRASQYLLSKYWVVGEGLGFFSFGSTNFGGEVLYEHFYGGDAENAWLRVLSEMGLLGVAIVALMFWWIVRRSWLILRSRLLTSQQMWIAWVPLSAAFSLAVWGLTHDIFSNTLTMIMFFISVGACEAVARRANQGPIKLT